MIYPKIRTLCAGAARTLCAGAALTALLSVSALAAVEDDCAAQLQAFGLFQGTQQGYELERVPTRAEAAVMLVRLLGAEQQALSLSYTAPFTDLKGWEAPYIQYLYQNGLAKGTSATTFSPQEPCSAQMYAAFLLRALGYDSATEEKTYQEAVAIAQTLGIYDACVDTETFQRGDAVLASYTALSLPLQNGDTTLLAHLMKTGAAGGTAAVETRALFERYAAYRADTATLDKPTAVSVSNTVTVPTPIAVGGSTITFQSQETATLDPTFRKVQWSRELVLSAPGVEDKAVASTVQVADHTLRRKVGRVQQEKPLSTQEEQALLGAYGRVPLVYITDMEKDTRTGAWTIQCRTVPSVYEETLWALENAIGELEDDAYSKVTIVQQIQKEQLTRQTLTVQFAAGSVHGSATALTQRQD